MDMRFNYKTVIPEGYAAMVSLDDYVKGCGLEPSLVQLVEMRVSQINGCAYCIDLHWREAHAAGESDQRLFELDAWREAPGYSDRERAALDWAEAVTLLTPGHVPDETYKRARKVFSEKELADLTLAVVVINAWNRLSISFRLPPLEWKTTK